jgi:hypothetical protein
MGETHHRREMAPSPAPVLRWGGDLTRNDLDRIFDLAVERFPAHAGDLANLTRRFRLNPEAFHGVFDPQTQGCLGFFVIVPLDAREFERTLSPRIGSIDREIAGGHMLRFDPARQTDYDVYLASIVMREGGSQKTTASMLIRQFFDFIQCLALQRGIHIGRLSAEAVTRQGRQICENQLQLEMLRERSDGTRVYAGGMRETLRRLQDDLCCFYPGRYVGLMSQYGL